MELHCGGCGTAAWAGGGQRQEHHLVHDSQLLLQGLKTASWTFTADRIDYVETYSCIFQVMPLHLHVSALNVSTDR